MPAIPPIPPPQSIASNLISVQPMSEPLGKLFFTEPVLQMTDSNGKIYHNVNSSKYYNIDEGDEDGILRIFIKTDLGFVSICNTILYSNDEEQVAYAYNELFTSYRAYLTWGSSSISKSCLEEVIYKILNDALKADAFYYNGEKFSPFTKLLAVARENSKHKNRPNYFSSMINTFDKQDKPKVKYLDLSKMILYYVREHDAEIKDEQIKFFLKKKLTDFTK